MTGEESRPIRLSLSEIDALARKAARGAGCPWGLAEEAGKAARWIAGYGLPGPEALASLLTARRSCGCTGETGAPNCAIASGAQLSDEAGDIADGKAADLGDVAEPLLLLGQASRSANALGVTLTLRWQDFSATCFPDALAIEQRGGTDYPVGRDVVCCDDNAAIDKAAQLPETGSRFVSAKAYQVLVRLAGKTHAPSTESSRVSGAGAATSDND